MTRNLFILALLLLSCCAMAKGSLKIGNYTGAGVSPDLQNQFLTAIINAYNKYKNYYYIDHAQSISDQLEAKTNYKYTVMLSDEVPQDSWFTLRTYDEIYAIWSGVNKMQITWTYYILASGLKSQDKSKNTCFYRGRGDESAGKGISANQKNTIKETILSLQVNSCSSAGKQMGRVLSQKDSQAWTSICKKLTDAANGLLLVTTNQQYFIGNGTKCACLTFA